MPRPTITVHLLAADGTRHTLAAPVGHSLMKAATAAGIEAIAADCGGLLTCATCHVVVDADWALRLPAPSRDEASMLAMTAAPREPTSRLSCQIELHAGLDGLSVRLPARQY
jgi:2Fe-2S ferredoxin